MALPSTVVAYPQSGESWVPFTGRRRILLPRQDVTAENLPDLLQKVFKVHTVNEWQIDYLFRYLRGDQPILQREKKIRPEICNKVVRNLAWRITQFKDGFDMGQPWPYVQKGKPGVSDTDAQANAEAEAYSLPNKIAALNEYLSARGFDEVSKAVMHNSHVCGQGYKCTLPVEGPSQYIVSSLYPGRTWVVCDDSDAGEPWLCGTYVYDENAAIVKLSVYSVALSFEVVSSSNAPIVPFVNQISTMTQWEVTDTKAHALQGLPIVEYPYNDERMGGYEAQLGEMDTLNLALSNRMDDAVQNVQALLWFNNCDIDTEGFDALIQRGGVKTTDTGNGPASVKFVLNPQDQQQSQTMITDLEESILEGAGVPDRNANASNNTGHALIIGQGWATASALRNSVFSLYRKSEMAFVKVLFRILEVKNAYPDIGSIPLEEVDVSGSFNTTDNLLTKTQGLLNMLEAGMHPKIALARSGLSPDAEQDYNNSRAYMSKWLKTLEAAQTEQTSATPTVNQQQQAANNNPAEQA